MQFEIFIVLKIYFMVIQLACHEVGYTGITPGNTLPSPYSDNPEGEGGLLGCCPPSNKILNNTDFVVGTMI